MLKIYSQSQMASVEKPQLDAGVNLMSRAAWLVARTVREFFVDQGWGVYGRRVLVFAGTGNNGADGLYAAVHLQRRGMQVDIILTAEPAGGSSVHRAREQAIASGAAVYLLADLSDTQIERIWRRCDLVLDAVLGTGGRGRVPGEVRRLANLQHQTAAGHMRAAQVWAIDLPSALGCSNAEPTSLLAADRTLCLGALKIELLLPAERSALTGMIQLLDIGLETDHVTPVARQLQDQDLTRYLPVPAATSHKYSRGVVDLVVGSPRYPGAAQLATGAALATGVGMVRLRGHSEVRTAVVAAHPETLGIAFDAPTDRMSALVLGSGMDTSQVAAQGETFRDLLATAAENDVPVVLDASGMELITQQPVELPRHTVLTPHAGELAQLSAALGIADAAGRDTDTLAVVQRVADLTGVAVLLKGARSLLVGPRAWGSVPVVSQVAPPQLAVAGSGDVLAGIIGGLLAQHSGAARTDDDFLQQVAAGQLLHACAARTASRQVGGFSAPGPITARQVAGQVGGVIAQNMSQSKV